MALPTLYSPEEIASHLKVKRQTVYGWLLKGQLEGKRIGQLWRIAEPDLQTFLNAHGGQSRKRNRT